MLCVDDDHHVLEGLRDTLRRSFDVRVATNGLDGLAVLRREPEAYAVVISDMRMPVMQGSVFLRESHRVAPDASRILLTGQADVEAAVAAVNDGQLFRFLTKPCPPSELIQACVAGLRHHRLVAAERELLERTLKGSVQALADVLALASPATFGRGTRIKAAVAELARAVGLEDVWEVEVAALMGGIGAITLPDEVAAKAASGARLLPAEEAMVARVPAETRSVLAQIPRLEGVIAILAAVDRPFSSSTPEDPLPRGAALLRLAGDHDDLLGQSVPADVAVATLRSRKGLYDPELLDALEARTRRTERLPVREVGLAELETGMTLLDDVRAGSGLLLVARGSVVSQRLALRLRNLPAGYVREPLRVLGRD